MRIYYSGESSNAVIKQQNKEKDFLALKFDRWDDYNFKTRFPTFCMINGEEIELGAIKILFEEQGVSFKYLQSRLDDGTWNGEFPIDNCNYVSVPEDLEFYVNLADKLSGSALGDIAIALRDASFLSETMKDDTVAKLIGSAAFETSLLRDQGSRRSFLESWKIIAGTKSDISGFDFTTKLLGDNSFTVGFTFHHDLFPANINVIIGPNGSGKSQTLLQLVNEVLNTNGASGNYRNVFNFSQVLVVSYSPFDQFPTIAKDGGGKVLKNTYRYFGFRKTSAKDGNGEKQKNVIDFNAPRKSLSKSFLSMQIEDRRHSRVVKWVKKVDLSLLLLKEAIPFDDFGIELHLDAFENQGPMLNGVNNFIHDNKLYISGETCSDISPESLDKIARLDPQFVLLKNGKPLSWSSLSSGQRLFTYLVMPIIGSIKFNSLIILDEPELYLHPSLEVALYRMLKVILEKYTSIAIIATHSLIAVREVPANCVHVLAKKSDGSIVVSTPPFETFGSDIQRISSYVFGDSSISKPYEDWITNRLRSEPSAEDLVKKLRGKINEEFLLHIYGLSKKP